jgi:hypothetical protein
MLTGFSVTLGTSPVNLTDGFELDREMEISVNSLGGGYFIGDENVADGDGYFVAGGTTGVRLTLHGDPVYAVALGETEVVVFVLLNVVK